MTREQRFGLPAGRSQVIFNGVVLDEPAVEERDADGRYVLALGRVVEKKGFDLLIRGFALVADRHLDVSLAIGGDGRTLPVLRGLAAELGIADRVRFLGRLTRSQVAAAMNSAELFVMPSRLEPFGIVVLEAWRAGRAVIATSRGGPPEFVDAGVTGLLADPFDTAALAAALDRLLGDQTYRLTIGKAARDRVADFAWPRIAEQYRQIYAKIPRARSA